MCIRDRHQLKQYLTSFTSLDCEYTKGRSREPIGAPRRIAFSGEKWRSDFRLNYNVEAFDGDRVILVNGANTQQQSLQSHANHHCYSPMVFTGRSLSSTNKTLLEIIEESEARISSENLNGIRGYRIIFDDVPSRTKTRNLKVSIFVDPQKEHAPRQISVRLADDVKKNFGWQQIWTVEEFSLVPDFATGDLRWFPKRATLTQSADAPTFTMHISKTRINPDLPIDVFRPTPNGRPQ